MKQIEEIPEPSARHIGRNEVSMLTRQRGQMFKPPPRKTAIRRILVPIDFSPVSLQALDYAAERAREWGASIILLHVFTPILGERRFIAPRLRKLKSEARLMKQRLLFLARKRVHAKTLVKPWFLNGMPGPLIIQAAARTKSDLIIMGSDGKKGMRRWLLGSVAGRVIRDADCPITIVPARRSHEGNLMNRGLRLSHGDRAAVVLIGPPGSGKTTLARALAERTPISIIEVGNLLKRELRRGTSLGKGIKPYTSTGKLVPLVHVKEIVSKALKKAQEGIVLFDGIPRSTAQILPFLEILAEHGLDLRAVIVLTLDFKTAQERLVGRRICNQCGTLYNVSGRYARRAKICERCGGELIQRQDDSEEVVHKRFERFERTTLPVVDFFKQEFGEVTWEQSATAPQKQRVERVWRRLEQLITPASE